VACNKLLQVADSAKAQHVLIVTVAFGDATTATCAAEGAELGPIFVSAVNAISPNQHLLRIPD